MDSIHHYGSTNKANRKRVWSELQAVYDIPNSEWMVTGDLNTIGGTQVEEVLLLANLLS